MCGIAGIVGRRGRPVEKDILEKMSLVLVHRGPDDSGIHVCDGVGLAHRRLSIIDLAGGHQPMEIGGTTITYNGEVYNYLELRRELEELGHRFHSTSDTEVVLRAYLEWGTHCVDYFNGMFAFVIHDPDNGKVFTARDHFGIKPLYWTRVDGAILFASEIKALLQHPSVTASPDNEAMRDYVTFQYVLGEKTLFRGIYKLLPGHFQTIDLETLAIDDHVYWEPRFVVDDYHTETYFRDRLRDLIEDSVRLQMRSDVAVGAHLSGGTDSSLVTILASRHAGEILKTFTGAFDEGPDFDESGYARIVAESCGAKGLLVHPTEEDFISAMPRLVYAMDEPAAGPGLFPQYVVSRLARDHVKVVLGGQGGDEIFGGYARYVVAYLEQAVKGAVMQSTEEGEHIVSLKSILPNLTYLQNYLPMMQDFARRGAYDAMDRRYFHLIDRSEGMLDVFSTDFRESFDSESVFTRFQSVFNHPETLSYFNKMVHFDMVSSLPALLQVEDRVSMSVSLESRVPLLDHRIVDLVTRMPPAMKFKGAEMKYVLKKAVGDILPPQILNRKDKKGFPVPLHLWARRGRTGEFIGDVFGSKAFSERGLFDAGLVNSLLADERPFGRRLWGLLNLEMWHRTFIDG